MPKRRRDALKVGIVTRVNWPMHCKHFIQVETVKIKRARSEHQLKQHDLEFSCRVCRMRGSFDDFATDERLRLQRWAV